MDKIVILAKNRNSFGKKNAELRKAGQIPAVVYGNNKENLSLALDAKEFSRAFMTAGHSTIVELKVDDASAENVLIQDISYDPVKNLIEHADFYRVNMNKTIRTEVPLHFIGEAPAVFQQEGSLFKNIEEVEVETLPANLPPQIDIDISGLDDFSKSIHISDIKAPEGVEILEDAEQLVCKVDPPRSEEEIAALEEEIGEAIPEGAAEEGEAEQAEAKQGEEVEPEAKTDNESK